MEDWDNDSGFPTLPMNQNDDRTTKSAPFSIDISSTLLQLHGVERVGAYNYTRHRDMALGNRFRELGHFPSMRIQAQLPPAKLEMAEKAPACI